ncbi:NUDIX hydrolase [Actinoallomurus oryzae]|uniref:NUDIX hydrolase n=2 Tax=Actinoallomurus TaxID=667113 RepID=A0ABP8Q670_9ACTN
MIQIATREVYRNRWMSVREDAIRHPDGSPGIYGVVDKPTAALIVPMENDGFHLVEQFRYALSRRSWEFPQGTWPDDRETTTEELARAELAQETGLRAATIERLGSFAIAPGLTSQNCDVFLATGLTAGEPDREPEEQGMRQQWFSRAEFERMLRTEEIVDALTVAAYARLLLRGDASEARR